MSKLSINYIVIISLTHVLRVLFIFPRGNPAFIVEGSILWKLSVNIMQPLQNPTVMLDQVILLIKLLYHASNVQVK